jgi:hypothetical protein
MMSRHNVLVSHILYARYAGQYPILIGGVPVMSVHAAQFQQVVALNDNRLVAPRDMDNIMVEWLWRSVKYEESISRGISVSPSSLKD